MHPRTHTPVKVSLYCMCWISTLAFCAWMKVCCRSPRCWIAGLLCSIIREHCSLRRLPLSVQSHERTSLKPLTANRTQDSRRVFYRLREKTHLFIWFKRLNVSVCEKDMDTRGSVKVCELRVCSNNLSLSSHLFLETIASVPQALDRRMR